MQKNSKPRRIAPAGSVFIVSFVLASCALCMRSQAYCFFSTSIVTVPLVVPMAVSW